MNNGLVEIYTGDGKGKTTAAAGLAVRARGAHFSVLFVQFMKGRPSAETKGLEELGIEVLKNGDVEKFIFEMTASELAEYGQLQRSLFTMTRTLLPSYSMVVLDEIFPAITAGMIGEEEVIDLIEKKPKKTELVLTGRGAGEKVMALADYVSVIESLKHPYEKGIVARKGIEY